MKISDLVKILSKKAKTEKYGDAEIECVIVTKEGQLVVVDIERNAKDVIRFLKLFKS